MSQAHLKTIVKDFEKKGKNSLLEPTTEAKIELFEKENQITLPSKYKEWLQISDGGEFFLPAGIQLYGIEHKPFIDVNDNSRPNESYIVIGTLASGDPILFKKESQDIAIYNIEANCIEPDEIYPDFISFLNDLPNLLGIGEYPYVTKNSGIE